MATASYDKDLEKYSTPKSNLSIKEQVGSGGFSTVFKVNHEIWGPAAYKKLKVLKTMSDRDVKGFWKEITIHLRSLSHPNVIRLLGVVNENDEKGLVLEWAERGSLDHVLYQSEIKLTSGQKLQIAFETACGMGYLHSLNPPILHGDIKSQNILIALDWKVKITDFGLSKWREISKSASLDGDSTLRGTITHIAPEMFLNWKFSPTVEADIYAFGVVLCELWTEKRPYLGIADNIIPSLVMDGKRPELTPSMSISNGIEIIINHSWHQEPSKRLKFDVLKMCFENLLHPKPSNPEEKSQPAALLLKQDAVTQEWGVTVTSVGSSNQEILYGEKVTQEWDVTVTNVGSSNEEMLYGRSLQTDVPTDLSSLSVLPVQQKTKVRRYVVGFTKIKNWLFVVCKDYNKITVLTTEQLTEVTTIEVNELAQPSDIVASKQGCDYLFISAYNDLVFKVEPTDNKAYVDHWKVEGAPRGISTTNDGQIVVCCYNEHSIKLFTTGGRLMKVVKLHHDIKAPIHCIPTCDNNFVICTWNYKTDQSVVCKVTSDGQQVLTVFGSTPGCDKQHLITPMHLLITNQQQILIADYSNLRIVLLTEELGWINNLLTEQQLNYQPLSIYWDEVTELLYVGDSCGYIKQFKFSGSLNQLTKPAAKLVT